MRPSSHPSERRDRLSPMPDEFQFPNIHVTRLVDEGGETFEEALSSPVCDFCMDKRARWDYDCATFSLPEIGFGSDEGFSSCDACADLVDKRAWNDLTVRVLHSWKALGVPIGEQQREQASSIVFAFADHYTPGRHPFG